MKRDWLELGLATLAICLIAPIGFRVAGALVTCQSLIIFVVAASLGLRTALISTSIYLLLGAIGLPVFGGFSGGWEKLIGPTAGFLWGFPLVAALLSHLCFSETAHIANYIKNFFFAHVILIAIGFGVLYLSLDGVRLYNTFLGLIPGLIIKTIGGAILALQIRQRIKKPASS